MYKGLPLALAFASLPTFAAPQLASEIQAGESWISVGISQTDVEYDHKNPNTGYTESDKLSSDDFAFSGLFALENTGSFLPVIALTFNNEKEESDTSKIFTGQFGLIKEQSNGKKMGLFVEYNHSDNPDATRGSYGAGFLLQTSDNLSKNYNQLKFTIDIPKSEGDTKGGRSLAITNTLKVASSNEIDFELQAALGMVSDIDFKNQDLKADNDLVFGLAGKIYFNLDPSLTISVGLSKMFGGTTYTNSLGGELNTDIESTEIGAQIISRF